MDRTDRPPGSHVDPAHLQPDDQEKLGDDGDSPGYHGELIDQWLGDGELSVEQQNLQRLIADEELLLKLQLHGFTGRPWERFAHEMAR